MAGEPEAGSRDYLPMRNISAWMLVFTVPFCLAADCGRESDPECGELVDTGWCDGNVAHNCNSWGEYDRSELPTG